MSIDETEIPIPVASKSLVVKLCEIMAAIGEVSKKGHNAYHNYDYATEADLVEAVRGELSTRHVFVFPDVTSHSRTAEITDIMVAWTFVDGDSGETWTSHIPGSGHDKGDKGVYKALTGSEKYLLMKAFLIPTRDDPEKDSNGDREQGKQAARGVATEKLREHANGDDSVVLTPWKQGRIALSGNGSAIIRAALSEDVKKHLNLAFDAVEKVIHIPETSLVALIELCRAHKVGVIQMGAHTQSKPVRANIPAQGFAAQPKPSDPIIQEAEIVKAGGKVRNPFLTVKWDRKKLTCFEVVNKQDMKPLWNLILANKGKPADFVVVQNGQYFNIEGIKRLNGHDYAQAQADLDAGTLEPPPTEPVEYTEGEYVD